MLTDNVLWRFSQLNRGGLPLVAAEQPVLPPVAAAMGVAHRNAQCDDVSCLPAGREVVTPWGKHWLRERLLVDIWPHGGVVRLRTGPPRSTHGDG